MDSAGRAADAKDDRAETYLRLLAESALRSASNLHTDPVRDAADVLVDAGVLADTVAAQIIADLNVALVVRGRKSTRGLAGRLRAMPAFRPGQVLEQPGSPAQPWRVVPAGPGTPASRLMALIFTTDRVLAPATVCFPLPDGAPDSQPPPFAQVTGTDDVGTEYRLGFSDGIWAGSAWTGTVIFYPTPPPTARWLAIMSPNGPLLRVNMTALAPGAVTPSAVRGPVPETLGERLLARRAEAMITALALGYSFDHDHPGPDEVVAVLEGAGVLAPLSPARARLAALGQLLGLPTEGPADEIPRRWMAVVTHYGRRRRLNPVTGTAAIAAGLPEVDGARFVIAGLHSGRAGTFLHVLADGLRRPVTWRRPAVAADIGFSWWFRDDADGWHLGAVEHVSPVGGREAMLRLAMLPPLGHQATTLTAEIRGATQQVTASLPVSW